MIEVTDLTKTFARHPAVERVSFRVDAGKIVGFLGPNGAGKTTTLRMITGYLEPTSGAIRVEGVDAIADPVRARRRIGYMPEGVPLYPEMRVVEYLRYRAALKGVPDRKAALNRSLEQANVSDAADRIIGQLSKGYRQRVGLADALLADPPILILDEPTAGLDPNQIREVRRLIREFAGKKTVLVSTHILSEVEAGCDEVIVIHHGRVVQQGALSDLTRTRHIRAVTRTEGGGREAFVAAVRALDGVENVEANESGELVLQVAIADADAGDIAESIFRAAAANGIALRELSSTRGGTLEEVFAELTSRDEHEEEDKNEEKAEE